MSISFLMLQDQTRSHLQRTANSKFASVVTMHDLLASSSTQLVHKEQNIIVYGATIEAFHALSWLEAKGHPSECVRHVVPDSSTNSLAACAQLAAQKLDIALQEPVIMTLTEVEEADENRLICAFEVRRNKNDRHPCL